MDSNTGEIAIIGAGIVGLTMAIGLAQKGIKKISMYEKRHEIKPTQGRMTSVYLSYRAISAFASVGIDATKIRGSLPISGFDFVNQQMQLSVPLPSPKEICMYSIDRQLLYEHLLEVASKFSNINIIYDTKVTDIDFEEAKITFEGETKQFDWIFAADGAFSETRRFMHEKAGFEIDEEVDTWGLQEVRVNEKGMNPEYHTFYFGPTSYVVFNISSRLDGTFDGQFYMDHDKNSKMTPEERRAFIKEELPLIADKMIFADETKHAKVMSNACKRYVLGRVMLIGDAACSQTPQLGIGLNASLRPVEDLLSRVTGVETAWRQICKEIEEVHCEDQMIIRNVVRMSRQTLLLFLSPPFVAKFKLNKYMIQNYPGRFTTFQEGCWYGNVLFKFVQDFINHDRQFTMEVMKVEGIQQILEQPGPNDEITKIFEKFEDGYKTYISAVRVGRRPISQILSEMQPVQYM